MTGMSVKHDQLSADFLKAWSALPVGTFDAIYDGQRWGVTRTVRTGGRQGWIWAEEHGGRGRVSANIYHLKAGSRLMPCEMPAETVIDFVLKARPILRHTEQADSRIE